MFFKRDEGMEPFLATGSTSNTSLLLSVHNTQENENQKKIRVR